MHVLQTAGYHIPTDVAIIGFDDLQEARATTPPLTSVRPQFDALGRMAAELLLAQIAGQVLLPGPRYGTSVLITRESCGCQANTDRLLAMPEPRYPAALRVAELEGRVELEFVVGVTGRVDSSSVVVRSAAAAPFAAAAREAILAARFAPARLRGTPVAVRVRQAVVFRITSE